MKQLYPSSKILIAQDHLQETKLFGGTYIFLPEHSSGQCLLVLYDYLPGSQGIPSVSYCLTNNWHMSNLGKMTTSDYCIFN